MAQIKSTKRAISEERTKLVCDLMRAALPDYKFVVVAFKPPANPEEKTDESGTYVESECSTLGNMDNVQVLETLEQIVTGLKQRV